MNTNIKSQVKKETDPISLLIYKTHILEDGTTKFSYIDSCHPMSKMKLYTLKNFPQEYLHNNDWY